MRRIFSSLLIVRAYPLLAFGHEVYNPLREDHFGQFLRHMRRSAFIDNELSVLSVAGKAPRMRGAYLAFEDFSSFGVVDFEHGLIHYVGLPQGKLGE